MHTACYIESNYFKNAPSVSFAHKFDAISHGSGSYFTKKHNINVLVGDGDTTLPPRPKPVRMRCKSKVRHMVGGKVATSQAVAVVVEADRPQPSGCGGGGGAREFSRVRIVTAKRWMWRLRWSDP